MASERLELLPGAAAAHLVAADDTGKTTNAFDPVDWRLRLVSGSLGTEADRAVRHFSEKDDLLVALIEGSKLVFQPHFGEDLRMGFAVRPSGTPEAS